MKKSIIIFFLVALFSCKKETNIKLNIYAQSSDKDGQISVSYDIYGQKQTLIATRTTPLNLEVQVPENSKYSIEAKCLKGKIYSCSIYWTDMFKNQKGRSVYVQDGRETKMSGRVN